MWKCSAPRYILQIPSQDFGLKVMSRSLSRGQVLSTDSFLVSTEIFWLALDAENPNFCLERAAFWAFWITCSCTFQDFFTGLATARIECSPFPVREQKVPAHSNAEGKFPITSVQADLGPHFWKKNVGGWSVFFWQILKIHLLRIVFLIPLYWRAHKTNLKAPFALLVCCLSLHRKH